MTKTVLITGTSSGLGRATATLFHDEGWNVVATMRQPDQEKEFTKLERMLVTRLDVQDAASIADAVQAGLDRFGRIDALVNNAGYGAYGPLEATPASKVRHQFEVNVFGVLDTMQALLPHFRANRAGTFINISSMGGRIAFPLGSLYHGSKFAVEGISEALHHELAALGIRVKLIEPGMIATEFAGRSFDFNNDPSLVEYQPLVQGVMGAFEHLSGSASTPEDIAKIVFVAATDPSDRLRYEAGDDAIRMLAGRRAADDAAFLSGVKVQFGIDTPGAGSTATR